MKKSLLVALLILGASAGSAWTQEHLYHQEPVDQHLDFIRNLRRRGYPSLAKEYTDNYMKKAAKETLPLLQLEQARTAVALAKEKRPDQRLQMLGEARAYFEPFVKSNPNSPAGAQARLELARLFSLQAQVLQNKALAGESEEEKEAGAKKARDLYDAADAEYDAGIKVMQGLKSGSGVDVVQAQFERANTLIDKALAFLNLENPNQNRQRAETIDNARKMFVEIAKDRESPNGLMANAYLVKIFQEGQDPPKIAEHYKVVMDTSSKAAEPAQRMARYYDILYVPKNPGVKGDKLKIMVEEIDRWLKDYPAARRTLQGESLRFEKALSFLQFAAGQTEGFKQEKYVKLAPKDKVVFDTYLKDATALAKELQNENGELEERAVRLGTSIDYIKIKLAGNTAKGFDAVLLQAKLAFQDASKAEKDDIRKKKFNEGQNLLAQALISAAEEKAPLAKVHEAQFMQASAFLGINDLRRGAISFEALARANPPSKKGAEAAGYAIELYKKFATEDQDETARSYLRDLGQFVLSPEMSRLWEGEKVMGVTRYNLAIDYQGEEKYKEALDQLEKLPADFPAFTYAQGQAMFIALKAREKAETPDDRKPWTALAKKALARMGPIPVGADPSTILMWFTAQVEGPKFMYAEASELLRESKVKEANDKYVQMSKNIDGLEAAFKKDGSKLKEDRAEAVNFTLHVLDKYAKLGQADIQYRNGAYDKVLEDNLLGSTAKEIIGIAVKLKPTDKIKVKDARVIGESLSLALRAYVQMGQLDAAKAMYALMLRVDSEAGDFKERDNLTRSLIKELADQVDEMKEKKEAAKLKEMVGKFSAFVDDLAKQLVSANKNPDVRDIKNLATFYSSLELYKKGAELFKYVPVPKHLDKKGAKFNEDEERDLYVYWDLQIENGKLLRQAGDYKESNKVFGRLLSHENARLQIIAEMQQIHIYEEMKPPQFGTATKLWKGFMEKLQRADIAKNPKLKDYFFEAYYYNTLCFYKQSQLPEIQKAGKSEALLQGAASMIVRLENANTREGWQIVGPKFQEFLAKEKTLRDRYETLKKGAK